MVVTNCILVAILSVGCGVIPITGIDGAETEDTLTITMSETEKYELSCHPAGGKHPNPQAACDRLDSMTTWGSYLFKEVSKDESCSVVYGSEETAQVTGSWAGRAVETSFNRINACEMTRWDNFVPVLPAAKKNK